MGKIEGHSLIKEISGSIGKDLYVRKSVRNTIFRAKVLYGAMPASVSRLALKRETMRRHKNEFNVEAEQPIDKEKAMGEFGDLLFSLVNYARFIDIDPEEALERTNKKFIKRFQFLETESAKDGKNMGDMSLAEMDVYWNKAKTL